MAMGDTVLSEFKNGNKGSNAVRSYYSAFPANAHMLRWVSNGS